MSASRRLPLVVVLGATGSGKSKLALEICRLFNGEIISADSMQIYKGLDIITNKVTKEELQQCPHHMIDYLCPLKEHHTVVDYRDMAVPIIDKLFRSNKIPIIVGGTNYYIEALVWKFLINKQDIERASKNLSAEAKCQGLSTENVASKTSQLLQNKSEQIVDTSEVKDSQKNVKSDDSSDSENDKQILFRQTLEDEDTNVLHQRLMEVDVKLGQRLHPHDKRKIIRALEVYHEHGIEMSNILKSQKTESGEESLRGPLRYDNTCIFWIQTEKKVLEERTDKRVDQMLYRGLVKELQDFHQQYNTSRIKENKEIDYTHGIFQSIGFKEFHEYLILSDDEKDSDEGKRLLLKGIEEMKLVTRRYARKQVRWINNRFLKYRGSNTPPVYGLDATDVSQWKEKVHIPAVEILTAIMKGDKPEQDPLPVADDNNTPAYNTCDVCGKVFTRKGEWQAHITSRKHHKIIAAKKKREQNEEIKRQAELKRTYELLNQHKQHLTQITKDKQGHSDSETLNGASDEDLGLFDIDSLVKNTIPNSERDTDIACDTELNDEVKIL